MPNISRVTLTRVFIFLNVFLLLGMLGYLVFVNGDVDTTIGSAQKFKLKNSGSVAADAAPTAAVASSIISNVEGPSVVREKVKPSLQDLLARLGAGDLAVLDEITNHYASIVKTPAESIEERLKIMKAVGDITNKDRAQGAMILLLGLESGGPASAPVVSLASDIFADHWAARPDLMNLGRGEMFQSDSASVVSALRAAVGFYKRSPSTGGKPQDRLDLARDYATLYTSSKSAEVKMNILRNIGDLGADKEVFTVIADAFKHDCVTDADSVMMRCGLKTCGVFIEKRPDKKLETVAMVVDLASRSDVREDVYKLAVEFLSKYSPESVAAVRHASSLTPVPYDGNIQVNKKK